MSPEDCSAEFCTLDVQQLAAAARRLTATLHLSPCTRSLQLMRYTYQQRLDKRLGQKITTDSRAQAVVCKHAGCGGIAFKTAADPTDGHERKHLSWGFALIQHFRNLTY